MSAENDLALAYHMGYGDALGKRMPDASKAQVLAPYDLAAENAKLREQGARLFDKTLELGTENAKLRERVEELEELLPENGRWFSAEVVEAYVAEIKKLRELVRDMHAVISDRNSWWDCMCKDTRRFANRMRELGVEVSG